MSGINLLPATVLQARAAKRRRIMWTRVIVGYCMLVAAAVIMADGVLVQPADALEARAVSLRSDVSAAEARVDLLTKRRLELEGELKVLREIHGQPDWSVLLLHLTQLLDDDISIRSVRVALMQRAGATITPGDLARGPYRVQLTGVAREQSHVTDFVLRIERAGLLEAVALKGTSPTTIDGGQAVGFSVSATLGSDEER